MKPKMTPNLLLKPILGLKRSEPLWESIWETTWGIDLEPEKRWKRSDRLIWLGLMLLASSLVVWFLLVSGSPWDEEALETGTQTEQPLQSWEEVS